MQFKKTLALTRNGDIALDSQDRAYVIDGPAGVAQELKVLLSTQRGEDPFNPNHGLRIFDIAGAPDEVLEREIRFALDSDDRVNAIEDIEITQPESAPRQRHVEVVVELVDETVVEVAADL